MVFKIIGRIDSTFSHPRFFYRFLYFFLFFCGLFSCASTPSKVEKDGGRGLRIGDLDLVTKEFSKKIADFINEKKINTQEEYYLALRNIKNSTSLDSSFVKVLESNLINELLRKKIEVIRREYREESLGEKEIQESGLSRNKTDDGEGIITVPDFLINIQITENEYQPEKGKKVLEYIALSELIDVSSQKVVVSEKKKFLERSFKVDSPTQVNELNKQANETRGNTTSLKGPRRFLISSGVGVFFVGENPGFYSFPISFDWRPINNFSLGGQFSLIFDEDDVGYSAQVRIFGYFVIFVIEIYGGLGVNYNGLENLKISQNQWAWSILGGARFQLFESFGLYSEAGANFAINFASIDSSFVNAGAYFRF